MTLVAEDDDEDLSTRMAKPVDTERPLTATTLGDPSHREKNDPALDCAREVLDGTICECGHLESSHGLNVEPFGVAECGADFDGEECGCCEFTPVEFVVRRA